MKSRLETLVQAASRLETLLVMPHHNPDPDALSSAAALCYVLNHQLKLAGQIAYSGIIGRAENKALVQYLNQPLTHVADLASPPGQPVALVDTHPGAGNIMLPAGAAVILVIDHHLPLSGQLTAPFVDIRPDVGATATILVEYLEVACIDPPGWLATALFYGIKTNTLGLGRNAGPADAAAYHFLQPKIDVEALANIEQARVPPQYFKCFDLALRNARIYNGLIFSDLGVMDYPDQAAEIADLLLRLERARWVVCVGGHQQALIVSVRTRSRQDNAERLAITLVHNLGAAGGHGTIAGGQIPLAGHNFNELTAQLVQRALQALNISPDTPADTLF